MMPVTPATINSQPIIVTVRGRFICGTKLQSRKRRKFSLVKLDTLMATQNHNHVITNPFMKTFGIGRNAQSIQIQRNIFIKSQHTVTDRLS